MPYSKREKKKGIRKINRAIKELELRGSYCILKPDQDDELNIME